MTRMSKQDGCRSAFTLVELLVVVVVLGLLMAILVPALSGAKRVSKRAVCGTRLHSIGTGLRMYLNDSNDFLPVVEMLPSNPMSEDHPLPSIADVLMPYLRKDLPQVKPDEDDATVEEGDEVFECPADLPGHTPRDVPNIGKSYFQTEKSSYVFAVMICGRKLSEVVRSDGLQQMLGGGVAEEDIWLMRDYTAFHNKAGRKGAVNYLYVDGRVGDLAR